MEGKRSEKVADLIRKEVSEMLVKTVKDARIGLITLTRVKGTEDCRSARIYFSVPGSGEEKERSLQGLRSATGYIRRELARRINLRYTPEITFEFDPSRARKLSESLLVTGFPYDIHLYPERSLPYFDALIRKAQGMRRIGSAALDLCYVAMGRFDGFWELKLHPWDTAAATLIVKQAGGRVTDFRGKPFSIYSEHLLASNGAIHSQIIRVLAANE